MKMKTSKNIFSNEENMAMDICNLLEVSQTTNFLAIVEQIPVDYLLPMPLIVDT